MPPTSDSPRPRLLVLELWGLGDLTLATTLLLGARAAGWDVTLVGKPTAALLLQPSFPEVEFIVFDAPWTVFRGKYHLWRWRFFQITRLLRTLRRRDFDAGASVRLDPRDHFFLFLAGARKRVGFPRLGSGLFLTQRLTQARAEHHKVEDWRTICQALGFPGCTVSEPHLQREAYRSARVDAILAEIDRPLVCLHTGARIAVRRWPADYFAKVIQRLRSQFHFHLLLVPESDVHDEVLSPCADSSVFGLSLSEMVDLLGRAEVVLCNDSGPSHIAAACGTPVIAIFGPGNPAWFRPWGLHHHVVIRDICALRPCFDYCPFPEPYCLTQLLPESAGEEIVAHLERLLEQGVIDPRLRLAPPAASAS